MSARRGCPPGHSFAPGLLVHRRQHPPLAGNSGCGDRRRRIGWRRPYHAGMVPSRRPRFGFETHLPHPAATHARDDRRLRERGEVNRRRAAEAALVFNVIVWGATFVLVKTALLDVSPILFIALRFTLATGALLAVFRGSALPWRSWKTAGAGALAGVFLFSGYVFQTLGLRLTTVPRSAFITGLTSVAVPLLAALVYRVRPQISEVTGVLIATIGLALMTLQGKLGPTSLGDLLTVCCALACAAHIVTLGHFREKMSFELLAVSQLAVSAALGWAL